MTREDNLKLAKAVVAYGQGHPVIVHSKHGELLHGAETLQSIVATDAALTCAVIEGVSKADFEASDWPEILEAARQIFMEWGGFSIKRDKAATEEP